MQFLDMRTVFFINVLIFTICTLIIVSLWRQSRHRFDGMGFLLADFAMQTAATFLIAMRGLITDWMSIALANILVLAGSILGYMGLERFTGRTSPQVHNYILLAVYAAAFSYFVSVPTDIAVRNLTVSLALFIIWFQCLWLMLYRVESGMRPLTLGVGMVFGALCLVNIIRIGEFFTSPHPTTDYFQSGIFQTLVIIVYQLLMLILTYNLMLMVNKRLLEELTAQEEKFAKAFRSSPYAIMLARSEDGLILEVNQGYYEITGYRADETIGRTTHDMRLWVNEEDQAAAAAELSKAGRVHGMEFKFRTKDGEEMDGVLYAEIITIAGENFTLTSINNITRSKREEEQLQSLNTNLQKRVEEETERRMIQERLLAEHARLAAMGKMISAIAHQWRQPLSTLGMIVQRFHAVGAMQGLTRGQLDDFKAGAMQQVRHMSDTIEEFRNFYLPEKQKVPFLPHTCIASAVKLLSAQFTSSGITVDLICPEDIQRSINGYPNEFKQVILNLMGNARDAILYGRTVDGEPKEGRVTVQISTPGENSMIIDIGDNGRGVPADIAPHIFDPYYTTKQDSGGSGIGLYMSRMIVEDSFKGRLNLVEGLAGANFRIELPLEDES